ncbi:major facilitator superfamily domain-containing protein 6-like [Clytia hemisphaerica]|uniref:major facilitator superfamily domain-containing protein 6-like n=1 Tax=Clytia hemisphaerica TaxID=252671 RepID=UPI0034D3FFB6
MASEDTISTSRSTDQICNNDPEENSSQPANRMLQFFTPDLRMVPSKLSYLFFYGAQACYITYFNVFFTSLGLTATQAGLITGLRAIPAFIGAPLWGMLADYTGQRKALLLLLSVMHLSMVFPMPWIAKHVNDFELGKNHTSYNNGTITYIDIKYCTAECGDSTMFYVMMSVMLASGFVELAIGSFLDSFVMNLVEKSTKKTNFGRQRLFGAIGFAATSFVAGIFVDRYEDEYLSDYTAAFYVFFPIFLIFIPISFYVAYEAEIKPSTGGPVSSTKSLLKPVLKTCGSVSNIIFLITVLLSGICLGSVLGFIFLYMENELSSSKTAMGLSIVVGNIGEVLMFPASHKIIKTIGDIPCLISGIFSYFLRFLLMSVVTNQWVMLPIQLLHSFGFALFFAAAIERVEKISPKEIHTTMVSIVNGLKFGFGILIANMAGGATYDRYGGKVLFRGMAFICLGWSCVMVFYFYGSMLIDRLRKTPDNDTKQNIEEL